MTPDRNKTKATREITAHVVTWLDSQGFKPIETECFVTRGWQADIATLICPTRTEAVRLHLAPRAPNWQMSQRDRSRAATMQLAHEAAYTALPGPISVLVEVKVTPGDLKQDRKWELPAPTDLRFLAVPPELLEMATRYATALKWGLLRVNTQGVRVIRWPLIDPVSVEQRLKVIYEIAIRRDHRTRHAALRETQKQARVVHNRDNVTPQRWSRAIDAVLTIANGGGKYPRSLRYETVEQVLRVNRVSKLPAYLIERLEELWGVLRSAGDDESSDTMAPVAKPDDTISPRTGV